MGKDKAFTPGENIVGQGVTGASNTHVGQVGNLPESWQGGNLPHGARKGGRTLHERALNVLGTRRVPSACEIPRGVR